MEPDLSFWQSMTQLLITNPLIISSDGDGIDVWLSSLNMLRDDPRAKTLTGILCTFDTVKRDAEIKLLIGCTEEDVRIIRDFLKEMRTLYIPNPMVDNDLSN
jgi:inorganic pyrophosphatase